MGTIKLRKHIVLIDDSQVTLDGYSDVIGGEGYKVTPYLDPDAAIDGISKTLEEDTPPDISVILCDIQMPSKDGPQTITEILDLYRRSRYPHKVPEILFMTYECKNDQESRALAISRHPLIDKLGLTQKTLMGPINQANSDYQRNNVA